jgi:hypothetical protein
MNPPIMNIDCAILTNCRFPSGRVGTAVQQTRRHFLTPLSRFSPISRVGHLLEVCTLSRPMMFQSVSAPLQRGVRFFRVLLPALPLSRLTTVLPRKEQYRLTTFRRNDETVLGSLCTPKVFSVHDAAEWRLRSDLSQPDQHLRVVSFNDASTKSSDGLTVPVTLALIRLDVEDPADVRGWQKHSRLTV